MTPVLSASQPRWLLMLLLLLIALLSLLPSLRLLMEAFRQIELGFDSPLASVMQAPSTWRAVAHSLVTAGLGTLIALVLGTVFAFSISLTNIRARQWLVFSFMLPMMIPPQVTALSWLQLFGPASPLLNTLGLAPPLGSPQPLYSAGGIALLLGIQHAPLVYLALRTSLLNIPRELIEAGRISGASQWRLCRDMILPLSRGGLIAGTSLAFVSALGNFGIPAMLGIPASYYVLPTLIYQHMAGFGSQMLTEVASLSILIGLLALAGVWLQQRLSRGRDYALIGHSGQAQNFNLGVWRPWLEALLVLVLLLILVAPLVALLIGSVVPALGVALTADSFTLDAYGQMLSRQGVTLRALGNSLLLSVSAALVLMLLSLPLAAFLRQCAPRLQTLISSLIEIPYALPGVVLAIACILLFARPLPLLGISIYGSLLVIFVAYLARFLSVAFKPVQAVMSQLDPSLEEAAQLAGASALRRLVDIILPLVAPALCAGGLLVFLIAVNELTVSALLWSTGNETLGVLIFNLDESGDTVLASAVSVVVVLMVAGIMALLSALGNRLPKGVIPWQS
ncbi:ABC transporter permease [Marinobacterium rhizophilum]|uniref:Iron ABC transporter permease n=1 Tax=Marinobacterium rhizophilum TaxID=420402 RepID=A0ABY5HGZ6_9GAMM|nr:iron ABC transporter permease [Marinobacterium rhizophilum]UTW11641.1 iron ABC transporter permease [Marinobacterium rhizophilum]